MFVMVSIKTVCAFATLLLGSLPSFAKHGKDGEDDDDDENDEVTSSASATFAPSIPLSTTWTSSVGTYTTMSLPPTLQFFPPENTTVCQTLTLRWESPSTLNVPLTLLVTNDRAALASSGPASAAQPTPTLLTHTLATDVLASATALTWSPVDVPPGTYVSVAFDTTRILGISARSAPFVVRAGKDVSCLATGARPPIVGPSTAFPTSASDVPGNTATATVSQTNGQTGSPGAKGPSPAVVGGTVAGVAVAAAAMLLVLAFTLPLRRFRIGGSGPARRPRNSRPGGPYYLF